MELVKIRLQNQGVDLSQGTPSPKPGPRIGPLAITVEIVRRQGFRGLMRGFPVTLIRDTPSYGAYFVSYEVLCRMLAPEGTDPKEINGVRLMLAGNFIIHLNKANAIK
jgi:solute carrier family 25 carnitine/acylcarnitine transporter 20/29